MEKVTYEDIQKANEKIKTTDIKGKDYAEVNQRIKAFRMVYPGGTIETEMLGNESNDKGIHVCIFKTYIYDNDTLLATGTAYEKEDSTFINKTSYIENCETSSVGRALGMAGFGIDTSVASAEEVQNAIANQENKKAAKNLKEELIEEELPRITDFQKDRIKELFVSEIEQAEVKAYLNTVGKSKISELSVVEASDLLATKGE